MKHYLLTRFNYGLYSGGYFHGLGIDADKWMDDRLIRFAETTLPAVESQTNRNFIWLVLIDGNTPEFYKQKIQQLTIKALIIDIFFDEWLTKHRPADTWIMTTRLDNDDFIGADFINSIQQNFQAETKVIDIESLLFWQKSGKVEPMKYNSSHNTASQFATLIEPNKEIKTVFSCSHWMLGRYHKLERINKILGVHIMHDHNAAYFTKDDK